MTMTVEDLNEGGCLCGNIRYSFAGAPLMTAACHCRNCQKQGGSAFSVVCVALASSYQQTGVTKIFEDVGESGQTVSRHFCPDCGSPIISVAEALPDFTIVKAGTLDNPSLFPPTQEAYCDSSFDWLPPLPGTQRFPRSNIG